MKIKPMVYQVDRCKKLLYNDIYKGFHFYIMNLGTHPTAYVEIPKDHPLYLKNYHEIDIEVHGGLTYSDTSLNTSNNTEIDNSWFIGWDYAHAYDYCGFMKKEIFEELYSHGNKKWTTEEIIEECKDVIDQIIDMTS